MRAINFFLGLLIVAFCQSLGATPAEHTANATMEHFENGALRRSRDLALKIEHIRLIRGPHEQMGGRETIEIEIVGRWKNRSLYRAEVFPRRLIVASPSLASPVRMRLFEAPGNFLSKPGNLILDPMAESRTMRYRALSTNRSLLALGKDSALTAKILVRLISGWGESLGPKGLLARVILPALR